MLPNHKTKAHPENSRESLLRAGKKLFAQNGFEGTTVRDIAQLAGVNLCLVSYHFDGKEGLYRSCIEEYGNARLQVANTLLEPVQSAEEFRIKLKMIIQSILDAQAGEPELSRILMREIEAGLPIAKDVFERTLLKAHENMNAFFAHAQKAGFVSPDVDPAFVTTLLVGVSSYMTRCESMRKKYFNCSILDAGQRRHVVDDFLRVMMQGIGASS